MDIAKLLQHEPELAEVVGCIGTAPLEPFPVLTAKFKLLWSCNLHCEMCDVWKKGNVKNAPRLSRNLVKTALDQLRQQGLRKVHFSGGEVLLHPDFRDIVAHARQVGLQVNMTTNGTLLDKDWARFLVDQRVHTVTISIDAPSQSLHDKIRGQTGAWRAATRAINHLKNRSQQKGRGPKIAINTVVSSKTIPHLAELHAVLQDLKVHAWHLLPIDTIDSKQRPTAGQWSDLAEHWENWRPLLTRMPVDWSSKRSAKRAEKGKFAGVFYPKNRCYAPWFNLFIDADGLVYPCCMGKSEMMPFGNLNTRTIDELLKSGGRRELRCSFAAGHQYSICEQCDDLLLENQAIKNYLTSSKGE